MAREGDVLENPVTGQRLIFRKVAETTGGKLLEVESVYTRPTPARPSVHYHPYQEERFEVLSGEVQVRIDGEERVHGSGETFTIPPGLPHTMWAERGGVRVNWRTCPALKTEQFFETAWGLARAGKVNDRGVPSLLQAAVLGRAYRDEYRLARPPWPVQAALLAVLAPVGGLFRYEASWQNGAERHTSQSARRDSPEGLEERTSGVMNEWDDDVDEWGPRSASWRLTALAGVGLVGLGAYGLARPKSAAEVFGLPLHDSEDLPAWRPKAARDLATGAIPLALLAVGERRAVGACAVASALIPALDAVFVALSGSRNRWQIAMHGGTAGLVLALALALFRRGARQPVGSTGV